MFWFCLQLYFLKTQQPVGLQLKAGDLQRATSTNVDKNAFPRKTATKIIRQIALKDFPCGLAVESGDCQQYICANLQRCHVEDHNCGPCLTVSD